MRNFTLILLILSLLEGFAFGQQNKDSKNDTPLSQSGIVERVISGDLLLLASGEQLRLMGADAPVLPEGKKSGQEPWASEAKKFTENLVLGKEVTFRSYGIKRDDYGRRVGIVYVEETCLDCELVKYGMAVVQTNRYIDNKTRQILVDAQREAHAGYRGIWNFSNPLPLPPKEFRAANNFPEGDDKASQIWKNVKVKTPRNNTASPSRTDETNSESSTNSKGEGANSSTVNNSNLQAAADTIVALENIENKIDAGISSGILAKLLTTAREKFAAIPTAGVDRALVRDLKDALDAYQLTLEAFKRKENAPDADRDKFKKYIDSSLEIAETSLKSASKRLEQLDKRK